jgi:hypothetical protein
LNGFYSYPLPPKTVQPFNIYLQTVQNPRYYATFSC